MTKHEHLAAYVECKAAVPGSADSILILFTHEQRDTIVSALRALSPPEPTEIDWKARAAELRTDDSDELQEVYDTLGITGQFSAIDEIKRLRGLVNFGAGEIERLRDALEAARAMPLQDHGKDSEIERLTLELGRTRAEVVQRQDDLGRLLHATEAKNEQQAKHIEELNAKMTCMCGSEINHSAWEGHSPVSMFDYAVEQEVERRLSRPMVAEDQTSEVKS